VFHPFSADTFYSDGGKNERGMRKGMSARMSSSSSQKRCCSKKRAREEEEEGEPPQPKEDSHNCLAGKIKSSEPHQAQRGKKEEANKGFEKKGGSARSRSAIRSIGVGGGGVVGGGFGGGGVLVGGGGGVWKGRCLGGGTASSERRGRLRVGCRGRSVF